MLLKCSLVVFIAALLLPAMAAFVRQRCVLLQRIVFVRRIRLQLVGYVRSGYARLTCRHNGSWIGECVFEGGDCAELVVFRLCVACNGDRRKLTQASKTRGDLNLNCCKGLLKPAECLEVYRERL